MKKITWILALLVIVFLGDRLFGFVLKQITNKSQFRYSKLYDGRAESDILLLGNSRGLIFYQPYIEKITKKKTFNLSYNGLPIELGAVLIKDYLEKYKPPKTLIIDVTMCDRSNNALVAGFNLYAPYSTNLNQLIHDSIPTSYHAGKLSHLYRYNSEVFQRMLFHSKKSDEDWLNDRVINDYTIKDIVNVKPYTIDGKAGLFSALKDIVELTKAKKVKTILVVNPYYPPFADKIINLKSFIAEIEKTTGLKVLDYSKSINDTSGFSDYQHLNKKGAKMFLDRLHADAVF